MSDPKGTLGETIRKALKDLGVEFEMICGVGDLDDGLKVVGIGVGVKESIEELGKSPRDQVIMVRVDGPTMATLDAWVESGAVKSRSEAAALFIKEGLMVRAAELQKLEAALRDVKEARDRLRQRAREVFGEEGTHEA